MLRSIKEEFYTISQFYTNYLKTDIHLDKTSPFVAKNWNIGFLYLRRTGLFSEGYLTKHNMYCTTFRMMLCFFTYSLMNVRFPRILFISHPSFPINEILLNLHIFENLRHIVFGIDSWFSGFLTIKRRNNQYARFLKGLKERQLYIGIFARGTVQRSRYMKNIVRYLKKPSIMVFLKNIGNSYFAGYESYVKTIPSIALVSPESKSFGFSGMTFTIPFPFLNPTGHNELQSFFFKFLWYTDFLNQKRIHLEKLKLDKPRKWHLYKHSPTTYYSLFCHYKFCDALAHQRMVFERNIKMQYKIHQPENILGSLKYFQKIQKLNICKKYISYNVLYTCNIMLSFLMYCIWKRQGQLYDKSPNMYIFRDKPLYHPFMTFVKFFLQFKKQIFQYVPHSVLYSKYFESFRNYVSKKKPIKKFRFSKHDMSISLRNTLNPDFFLTVRKLRTFSNLSSLMYSRIFKKDAEYYNFANFSKFRSKISAKFLAIRRKRAAARRLEAEKKIQMQKQKRFQKTSKSVKKNNRRWKEKRNLK